MISGRAVSRSAFMAAILLLCASSALAQGLQIEFMAADVPWTNPAFTNFGFMSLVTT
jgi:hypothetical protein